MLSPWFPQPGGKSLARGAQDGRVVPLIAILVVVGGVVAIVFWYGLRGDPNRAPALGTNRPAPDGLGPIGAGADEAPYSPTFVISDDEEFRRDAGHKLHDMQRSAHRYVRARSWMEEPGALESAGLVDAATTPDPTPAPPQPHKQRRSLRRHHVP